MRLGTLLQFQQPTFGFGLEILFPGPTKTQTARMQLLSLEVARTILCADAVVLAAAVTGCAAPGTWGCVGTATYAGAAKWREVSS